MTTWKITAILRPRVDARYSDGSRVCVADMATKILIRTDDLVGPDDAMAEAEWMYRLLWPGCDLVRVVRCVVEERGDEVVPA